MKDVLKLWSNLAGKAKRQEFISDEDLWEAYRAVISAVVSLRESEGVSREACATLMKMDEFIYYATILDENYMGDVSAGLYELNFGLKQEFFCGVYRSEFFLGPLPKNPRVHVLRDELKTPSAFLRFLKNARDQNDYDVVQFL